MKKVARLRQAQDEFVPPHNSIALNKAAVESNVGVRTTGRIKKPKAVFDPSDNYVPRAQRSLQAAAPPQQQQHATSTKSPSSSTTTSRDKQREHSLSIGSNSNIAAHSSTQDYDICSVCQKREPRRGGNYRNKLLTCVDCNEKLHRGCASTDFFDSSTTALRQSYKCDGCRTCEICGKGETNPKKNYEMITCSKCILSFHLNCHNPKVSKHQQASRSWKCAKCMPSAPTTTTTTTKSKSANDDDSMPVTVIRQIIGYDANMQPLPKAQNQVQAVNRQPTPETAAALTAQPKNEDDIEEAEEQPHSPEAISAAKSNTDSHATSSSSSECELTSDDDEDFHYVEKKKRKIVAEYSSNGKNENSDEIRENGNKVVDIDMANDDTAENLETEQKPQINDNRNRNAVNDSLPKREVIKTWSVEKLFDYVVQFFPKEAHVFKEHEIDGNALLLLKRSDVVKKLPLKLGPSLRLFQFILKIQTQKANDPTLGWDCSIDTLLASTE